MFVSINKNISFFFLHDLNIDMVHVIKWKEEVEKTSWTLLKIINVDLLMTKEEETSKEEATNKKLKVWSPYN
jgi:hypothetical protein